MGVEHQQGTWTQLELFEVQGGSVRHGANSEGGTGTEANEEGQAATVKTAGYGLKLTLDITKRDVSIWIDRRSKGFLSLNLEIGMSHHHQSDMTFNGEQLPYLIVPPTKRLLGNTVEILDFPPDQIVTDDRLGRERERC